MRVDGRVGELTSAILSHFDKIHSIKCRPVDTGIERMIIEDEVTGLENDTSHLKFENGLITFSPSSASKCERELFFKGIKAPQDEKPFFPYHNRWMRNGSAIHSAVQKDLLYGEKYVENPAFTVVRTKKGRPAWEKNIRYVKQIEHNGVRFQIYGMCDGVLVYTPDNSKVGFEFKTKSTTIGAIGDFKMKDAQPEHREQCTAYSILFNLNEYLIVYESLAKDQWNKNEEAKPDMRAFYVEITDHDKTLLLDKFAKVAQMYYEGKTPSANHSKCIFCLYKSCCGEGAA